jgi:hypothetical protein
LVWIVERIPSWIAELAPNRRKAARAAESALAEAGSAVAPGVEVDEG